ncbi:hypothetical protein LTR56_003493 [Elasticomyces elasticus]|nr:hypothetical protein LTR22_010969 [Elasticomyces elasticus]KAK3655486.1 hypothetical protein LTR56_003493 [Elasticomyces elasticus]KAK4919877.1 hypothetical protein LTR49_012474 [Elasticomyces elasticus]KAK5756741.1 hypothetical protein LTS12_013205 [Elasticomyces elasticus]
MRPIRRETSYPPRRRQGAPKKITWPAHMLSASAEGVKDAVVSSDEQRRVDEITFWANEPQWIRGLVDVPQQFFEGNCDAAMLAVRNVLEPRGLWVRATRKRLPHVKLTEEQSYKVIREEYWVNGIIIQHISPMLNSMRFLELPLAPHALLRRLEGLCRPFRFLDLPRKFRDRVYEELLVCDFAIEEIDDDHRLERPTEMRVLSASSSQLRQESAEMYYGRNHIRLGCEVADGCWTRCNLMLVRKWANVIGMVNLRHLQHLEIYLGLYKGCWHEINVKYSSGVGLMVETKQTSDWAYTTEFGGEAAAKGSKAYAAFLEQRRVSEGWQSTGVIEFFLSDPDALRLAVCGPEEYVQDEGAAVDEHDAYQVAYGPPPEKVTVCPW